MRGSRPRRWGSTLLWPRTIEAIVNTFIRFNSWAARRPAEVASMAGLKKIPAAARPFLTRLLRTEEVLVKGKEKSKAKLFPRTPNAEEVIAVRRPVPETARHAQVPWTTAIRCRACRRASMHSAPFEPRDADHLRYCPRTRPWHPKAHTVTRCSPHAPRTPIPLP